MIILGYYSDVAVVFEVKDTDRLMNAARDWDKKHDLDGDFTVEKLIDGANKDLITKDKKYHLLVWNSIKWYANFSAEKVFVPQEFFESLDDYDIPYDFVRIGEDMGDYEIQGDLDSDIVYPEQSLWFNKEFV